MSTAKQDVAAMLNQLPDDVSIEDIQYHLYVLEKIRRGLEAADRGETVPHEEVVASLKQWLVD
jgi:predicted transcriptional regulator